MVLMSMWMMLSMLSVTVLMGIERERKGQGPGLPGQLVTLVTSLRQRVTRLFSLREDEQRQRRRRTCGTKRAKRGGIFSLFQITFPSRLLEKRSLKLHFFVRQQKKRRKRHAKSAANKD